MGSLKLYIKKMKMQCQLRVILGN